jgi:large subunit ribosomal protein L13
MIVDATNLIAGRLGSLVAKKALLGEKIDIVNAEKAVISGKKQEVFEIYKRKVSMGTWAKGPHYIRSPERLLKRIIRDMLPYKKARGIAAYKNVMCWEGIPDQFKGKELVSFKEADVSRLSIANYISIRDISKHIGGRVE